MREKLSFFVVLFVVLTVVYVPALDYGPNIDDREGMEFVSFHGPTRLVGSFYHLRPVKNLLLWGGQGLFGDSLRAFRLCGLVLFFVHLFVLELYLERLLGCRRRALAGTAIYALLAVQSSVVVWISAYHILIYALTTILALYWADRAADDGSSRRYVLSAAAVVVSLLSYEAAVVFPVLLLLQARVRGRDYRRGAARVYAVAVIAIVAVYLVARFALGARIEDHPENLSWPAGERWWLTLSAARYVLLHVYYALDPWTTFGVRVPDLPAEHAALAIGAWVVLSALTTYAVILLVKQRSMAAFGWLFFVVAIAPMANFVPVASGPVADYFLTLASVGLVAVVVTALARGVKSAGSILVRRLIYAAVGVWLGANVFSTVVERVPAWSNPLTLTEHAREVQGESFFHDFLAARMRAGAGDYAGAVRLYDNALGAAPYHEPSQVGHVVALINAHDLETAEQAMDGLSPRTAEPRERLRVSRAFVLEARGDHDEAATLYRAIINDETPAGMEAKITALVRLTYMSRRWGIAMDVPYSLEQAPFDVQRFYLFPGYHTGG